jgi:hypothetical protein
MAAACNVTASTPSASRATFVTTTAFELLTGTPQRKPERISIRAFTPTRILMTQIEPDETMWTDGLATRPHVGRFGTVVVGYDVAPALDTVDNSMDNASVAVISGRRRKAPVVPLMSPSSHFVLGTKRRHTSYLSEAARTYSVSGDRSRPEADRDKRSVLTSPT